MCQKHTAGITYHILLLIQELQLQCIFTCIITAGMGVIRVCEMRETLMGKCPSRDPTKHTLEKINDINVTR